MRAAVTPEQQCSILKSSTNGRLLVVTISGLDFRILADVGLTGF
jgi:hypothetical protein